MSKLRHLILNGAEQHPGANYVNFPNGDKRFVLKYVAVLTSKQHFVLH